MEIGDTVLAVYNNGIVNDPRKAFISNKKEFIRSSWNGDWYIERIDYYLYKNNSFMNYEISQLKLTRMVLTEKTWK